MPKRTQRGQKGNNPGNGGGTLSQLLGLFGGGSKDSTIPNEDYDASFDPNKEGAYAYTSKGFDPNVDYQSPLKDNRSFLQRYSGVPDYAGQINSQVASANALQPSTIALQKQLNDLQTQQAVSQAGGIQKVAQQGEDFEAAKQGKALVDLAQGGQIPYSTIPGKGGSYPDIASAYKMLYGGLANSGAGAAPSSMLSTISGNQAKQAIDVNTKNEAIGEAPYASTIGDLTGRGNIQNHQLSQQYAPELAASKALEYKGRALISGMVPGGFDFLSKQYFGAPTAHETTETGLKSFPDPNNPGKVIKVPGEIKKFTTTPPYIKSLDSMSPASQDEINNVRQPTTIPAPVSKPSVSTVPTIVKPPVSLQTTVQDLINANQINRENVVHVEGKGRQAKTIYNDPKEAIQTYIKQLESSVNSQKPGNRQSILDKISELKELLKQSSTK